MLLGTVGRDEYFVIYEEAGIFFYNHPPFFVQHSFHEARPRLFELSAICKARTPRVVYFFHLFNLQSIVKQQWRPQNIINDRGDHNACFRMAMSHIFCLSHHRS